MRIRIRAALMVFLLVLLTMPCWAQNSAGPADSSQAHDYAQHVGKSTDKKLSTGWTGGKGKRTTHVTDSYRHTKSGNTVHVHGYYRSHK